MSETIAARSEPSVQILDLRECWTHLELEQLGRLAVTVHGAAEIFPVNYLAVDGRIRFRTDPGTKLVALIINNRVTFEIDGFGDGVAWSVIVKGLAEEIDMRPAARQSVPLPVPWTSTEKGSAVEITPDSVSGRRFQLLHGPGTDLRATADSR
ncbi:MAG: pyridoxamine 5-phosphate oxidase family protein [Amnibacterium sp.]|nr:pyridoxamine 5-phosphate oxidase family protein [Amnibacterium sp.]